MYQKVISRLISNGHQVESFSEGYIIPGFYKHGEAILTPMKSDNQELFELRSRCGSLGQIFTYDDLVKANCVEWLACRDRVADCPPDELFVDDMIRLGLIEKVVEVKYIPK